MDAKNIMGAFKNFFSGIGDRIRAKKYLGIIGGDLPGNSKAWGDGSFLTANEVSLYTNRAIAKRAEKVGEIEFILRKRKTGDLIENDPLLDLLYRPNQVFTGRQFWSLYQKYYDLIGEVYIFIESNREIFEAGQKVTGLHLLNPTMVTKKFNKETGLIESYEYKTDSKTTTYQPSQILYIHNPDPKSPLNGQSLLKAGIAAIQTETQISTYHSRVLENGGKVEGVFKFKTILTEEKLKSIKDDYKKEYSQAKKAGLPLFLGSDGDYVKTGLTPGELDFLGAKKMTLEDICILTGTPKAVLGSFDEIQYSNADASIRIFLRETIRPLMRTLATFLDEKLFPKDVELDFIDPTPENIDERLKETENGIKNYYMTPNEARERHGLDPVANGDDILHPFNLIPLGENTPAGATGNKRIKKAGTHPLQDADLRELYGHMQVKRMDAREKPFTRELNSYFNDQRDRLIARLDPSVTRVFRKKGLFDENMQLELEVKIGKESFIPVLTDLVKQAGEDAMITAGSEYDFELTADIGNWVENRSEVFMRQINETTFGQLRAQFEESLGAGESRDQLIKRIKDTYGDISTARAATIARTEVHNATQSGTLQGYKQAGLTIKVWVTVGDGQVRDSHAAQDGEERPINMAFSNGLMYPGDPSGPAEEVINCRCVI